MRKIIRPVHFVLPSLLALGHIGLYIRCVTHDTTGWSGILVVLADFPVSILFAGVSKALSFDFSTILLIGGTVWWFCLGFLISLIIGWFWRPAVKLSKQPLTRD
jgi:hypothetical protein